MPMYDYVCDKCNTSKSFLDNREVAPESRGRCKKCSTGIMNLKPIKTLSGVYICAKCNFHKEYRVTTAYDCEKPPEDGICPECHEGEFNRDFVESCQGIGCDIVGGYDYEYGKKAFHRMPPSEYAKIISGEKDPY